MITPNQRELALLIYAGGGIQFGDFTLKMHEKHPNAPKSPIYINLRGEPKGKFTAQTLTMIGYYLALYASEKHLTDYHLVVGLPKAGEPLADAFAIKTVNRRNIQVIKLEKEESGSERKITPTIHGEFQPGQRVLMVDDLITAADTKLEGASALRGHGLVVEDCLVVVDRQQGGASPTRERRDQTLRSAHLERTTRFLCFLWAHCGRSKAPRAQLQARGRPVSRYPSHKLTHAPQGNPLGNRRAFLFAKVKNI